MMNFLRFVLLLPCVLVSTAVSPAETDRTGPVLAGGYISPESYPGMQLVWRDEFGGKTLNETHWSHETGTGADGWGNSELQYYLPGNTTLQDGYLVITARAQSHEGSAYTSARIVTRGKQEFRYARVDFRASLPEGQGMWPALWMLGANMDEVGWPACGEIDVMEMIGGDGRENTVHGTLHWQENIERLYEGGMVTLPNDTFTGQFHVFSIIWDENRIQWLADNRVYFQKDISDLAFDAFRAPFYLVINLAVGGKWPGAPDNTSLFPQRLVVDDVRVFQKNR
jgi:beta-glucanase (GH16 family)